jgi:predicted acyl esterase
VRRVLVVTLALAATVASLTPAPARAADPPPGSVWSEEYFPSGDGTLLHADVLRPAHLPRDARTPVIVTASPYMNHSGGLGVRDPDYDPLAEGPSPRFFDFLTQAKVFQRGYTYVMVDLRGFGGSAGCNDWGGPGEQMDVKATIEWAATRPWSTGKVAHYGKSYDAWTGLMALAQRPRGLAAVVSMEPVVDGYRYLYMNRVRFANSVGTPAGFQATDASPGAATDTPTYQLSGADANLATPGCYATNIAFQQNPDPAPAYWGARNLVFAVRGVKTPTFMTQGFLETNTKPDAVFTLWNNLAGPNRAWFGQFDHIRGNDVDATGTLLIGRAGFLDEVMRFLDHHVRGLPLAEAPTHRDPPVVVQSFDGRWRSEREWPPADTRFLTSPLSPGSYSDTASNSGTANQQTPPGDGVWTFSQPLATDAHVAGTPRVSVNVETLVPEANLVANVYDVGPNGNATLMSRGAYLLPGSGAYAFELYGQDWVLPAGHRIGVLLSSSNQEWWLHVPSLAPVTIASASISLPFLEFRRDRFIDGRRGARLAEFTSLAPFVVAAGTIAAAQRRFELPRALRRRPASGASARNRGRVRATARIGRLKRNGRTRVVVVHGRAPSGARLTVSLLRNGRFVARRRVRGRFAAYHAHFRFSRPGRYSARVRGTFRGRRLRATARPRRIR